MAKSKSKKVESKKSISVSSNGTFVRKNRASYPEQAWVVYTKNGDKMKSPRVFEETLSRDAVRNAYSKELDVTFQETRSRRVSNIK